MRESDGNLDKETYSDEFPVEIALSEISDGFLDFINWHEVLKVLCFRIVSSYSVHIMHVEVDDSSSDDSEKKRDPDGHGVHVETYTGEHLVTRVLYTTEDQLQRWKILVEPSWRSKVTWSHNKWHNHWKTNNGKGSGPVLSRRAHDDVSTEDSARTWRPDEIRLDETQTNC